LCFLRRRRHARFSRDWSSDVCSSDRGERGLIDKRHAYEESIRVPMLAWAPGMIEPGTTIEALVRNIDVAPTVLELFGVRARHQMDGQSFLGLLTGSRDVRARTADVNARNPLPP